VVIEWALVTLVDKGTALGGIVGVGRTTGDCDGSDPEVDEEDKGVELKSGVEKEGPGISGKGEDDGTLGAASATWFEGGMVGPGAEGSLNGRSERVTVEGVGEGLLDKGNKA
jgi:hypothetical protein